MKKIKISKVLIHTILIIWTFLTVYPLVWTLINSFKSHNDILTNSFNIPFARMTFDNYRKVLTNTQYNLVKGYLNSFIISGSVVVIVLLIAGLAAYVLARYEFKGKKIINALIIASMMLPVFSVIQPLLSMILAVKLNDTRIGIILPQVAGNASFAVVILTGFIQQLPVEIEESAYMDGANVFQVIFRLVFPMAKSAFATTAIFTFLWSFNDLFLQMYIIRDADKRPIVSMLERITADSLHGGVDNGAKTAAAALAIIPVLIVYFFLQKHIIKGLTAGAIKG